ncbi:undecaprenyl-diphosphatase UppP [Bacillus horti]|nr:undecaprenyl-diphosphatase UppP [Bacillus horti]
MSLLEALILGIVQGLTEALPISSSAHIIITEHLLGLTFEGLTLEVFLHLASVLAVIIYFRKDLVNVIKGFFGYLSQKTEENKVHFRFGLYIIVATMITGVLGILLKDLLDESLKSPAIIAASLTLTGILLIFIERFKKIGQKTPGTMTWKDTLVVALAQSLAIIPGISRSGSTLVAGLLTGLDRKTAVRFSFLLAIPVILGSSILEMRNISGALVEQTGVGSLAIGFIASFIFSLIGIVWLIKFLEKSKLFYFAIYCFLLAGFVLIYL